MEQAQDHDRARVVRGIGARRVRLACGLVLFAYVVFHLVNHALGNVSLEAMEAGLEYHVRVWHSWPGTTLLYSALTTHALLGLWALYERRHFRWKMIEGLQLAFGLLVPVLLAAHLTGQRVALAFFGIEKGYAQVLWFFWVSAPEWGWGQLALIIVVWVHACIGLFLWLRLKRLFRRAAPFLLAAAVLLPALALLGYYQGGRAVAELSTQARWRDDNLNPGQIGTPAQGAELRRIRDGFLGGWVALIGLVFVARGLRVLAERRGGAVRLTYPDGRIVSVPCGYSVLEASWHFDIPHASICGGRGRCSTCRIRIVGDRAGLPEPSAGERAVLARVGAAGDPALRLACQLRPRTDIAFVPLLPPNVGTSRAWERSRTHAAEERYVVSMFVDMRGSTRLGEQRLPFDTVFVINRFLAAISQAVIAAGGEPNQFLGDGLLALFGLRSAPAMACRAALDAAARIGARVAELNALFVHDLAEPIRFGIGIHAGVVIVGDVGYDENRVYTALGDAVNVAARLQDMTKGLACEVVLSDEVRGTAGVPEAAFPSVEVAIRGRSEPMVVRTVVSAGDLRHALAGARAV